MLRFTFTLVRQICLFMQSAYFVSLMQLYVFLLWPWFSFSLTQNHHYSVPGIIFSQLDPGKDLDITPLGLMASPDVDDDIVPLDLVYHAFYDDLPDSSGSDIAIANINFLPSTSENHRVGEDNANDQDNAGIVNEDNNGNKIGDEDNNVEDNEDESHGGVDAADFIERSCSSNHSMVFIHAF